MPTTIFGLPSHILLVHATVVFVPLAALVVLVAVCYRRFRVWAGPMPLVLSFVALVFTVAAASAGEALERAIPRDPSGVIHHHAQMGNQLRLVVLVLFVGAAAMWWFARRGRVGAVVVVAMVIAVLGALGSLVDVTLVGHSGATAVWCGTAQGTEPCPHYAVPRGGGESG